MFEVSRGIVVAFVLIGALSLVILNFVASLSNGGVPSTTMSSDAIPTGETATRDVTETELSNANGEENGPLYIAVKDPYSSKRTVFDVSSAREFYGPGGPYHVFVACDATTGLAKSSVDKKDIGLDPEALTEHEKTTLLQWYQKYEGKYPTVGQLVPDGLVTKSEASVLTAATEPKKDV